MQININIRNEWKFFSYFKIISRVETASIKLFYRGRYTIVIILFTWDRFFPEFSSSNAFKCTAVEVSK